MADDSRNVETTEDFGKDKPGEVARWLAEIDAYNRAFEEWKKRAQKIVARYRDERVVGQQNEGTGSGKKFNILWANVQTLQPALFSKKPIPDISRRYKDRDPVGLAAADILERAVTHCLDMIDFETPIKLARDDYLLAGRGVIWERYVPSYGEETKDRIPLQISTEQTDPEFVLEGDDINAPKYLDADGKQVIDGVQFGDDGSPFMESEPYKPVVYEDVFTDYINWEDFGHTPAPVWEKVRAVWKRELMTREQLVERFPKVGAKIQLTKVLQNIEKDKLEQFGDVFKRGEVYEIWDKTSRKAIWVSPGYVEGTLDKLDDPLKLENFFPCPRPLYATMTGDRLVPVPDYYEYQDQANAIDTITQRIDMLVKALKVSGAYDAAFPRLEEIIKSNENTLVPVDNWAMFAEKGGIKGAISFVPLSDIAAAITSLTVEKQNQKRDLYEISGLSDIIRGQGAGGRATATEQKIKGQFANLRLSERQGEVRNFVRDAIRIKSEIIAEHFDAKILLEISGWLQTPTARALDAAAAVKGTPNAKAMFDEAIKLLRDDHLRSFRIDVETDSTVMEDAIGEKEARSEFMIALAQFLQQALPAAERYPQLGTALAETLFFGVRGFKAGRHLEAVWEQAIEDMAAAPPQQQGDDGKAQETQVEMARLNLEQQEAAHAAAISKSRLEMDARINEGKAKLAAARLMIDGQKLAQEWRKFMAEDAMERERLGIQVDDQKHRQMIEEGNQILETINTVGTMLTKGNGKDASA